MTSEKATTTMPEPFDLTSLLECPHCHGRFSANDFALPHACLGRPVLQPGSLYDFSKISFYWNQIPENEMAELLVTARKDGWRTALENHLKPKVVPYKYRYTVDARRGDWFPLCSLGKNSLVVDIGAGWGAVSTALASMGCTVLSADSNRETLDFLGIRARQEGLNNIHCIRTDPLDLTPLPLADGIADLVIMNGVLEWIGSATKKGDPRKLQLCALADACRVLKPGGQLYLGIESRFGHSYWRGGQDHSLLAFTSLLPRPLASLYMRMRGKGPYRTYTHSHRELKKLFHKAGFSSHSFYTPFPSYRFTDRLVPIDDRRTFMNNIRHVGISRKQMLLLMALAFLNVHQTFVDDYCVVVKK